MEKLNLVQEWDKTFPKSDKVNHRKMTFVNRYGNEIRSAVLVIHGASHTDLFDGGGKDAIPFDKVESFFMEYLK